MDGPLPRLHCQVVHATFQLSKKKCQENDASVDKDISTMVLASMTTRKVLQYCIRTMVRFSCHLKKYGDGTNKESVLSEHQVNSRHRAVKVFESAKVTDYKLSRRLKFASGCTNDTGGRNCTALTFRG